MVKCVGPPWFWTLRFVSVPGRSGALAPLPMFDVPYSRSEAFGFSDPAAHISIQPQWAGETAPSIAVIDAAPAGIAQPPDLPPCSAMPASLATWYERDSPSARGPWA